MDTIEARAGTAFAGDSQAMVLEDFLPYRLSILSNAIGRALARLYERRFGLTVGEWRVIANLARFGPLSANGVCDRSAMDKVQVSRAVAKAVEAGLIHRAIDPNDRRRSVLTLTAKGRAVHDQIIPLANDFHVQLRSALSGDENEHLCDMLTRLTAQACTLRNADGL
ncbi:MAG: MarR family transcriptional regulator [Azospirillum sp.]|nr:MarR family transcriptional regulator [Azospirillum sp.]